MNSQQAKYVPSYGASKLQSDHISKGVSNLLNKSSTIKQHATTSLSGSETDVSTSTENLSQEERYVIKHTARQEPQGQEKQEPSDGLTPHPGRQLSLDNASSYNTLIIHATGEDGLDPWASLSPSRLSSLRDSYISATSSHSKTTSFPSSSNSSSPTLSNTTQGQTREINEIPDDYLSQSHVLKHLAKEMKVVTPDFKEEFETNPPRRLLLLDLSPEAHSRIIGHRYSTPIHATAPVDTQGKLSLSRSQPDLTQLEAVKAAAAAQGKNVGSMHRQASEAKPSTIKTELVWPASEMIQLLVKENSSLKTELEICFRKVAKSQKLEEEVTNIHRSHQELMQSSDRREKLERAARQRLQEDNRMLRQQYELLLAQIESPLSGVSANSTEEILLLKREIGKRDTLLAQLMAQNKELTGCRERQEIELAAQRATLQEQRTHIEILDTALTNAQTNVMRLEEECRKRQLYEERVVQLQQNLSSLQMARDKLEGEINDLRLSRRVNNAAAQNAMLSDSRSECKNESHEVHDLIEKVHDREERLAALENEVGRWQQWYLEENGMRQAAIEAASIPKDAKIAALEKTSQESERLITEARTDKIRQLDELHAAQRRLADVEGRTRELESKLAEKEAMIKVLQQQHHSGSVLSRTSPHHHLHHSSSSSFHRQPSPSPMSISNSIMLSSLTGKGSSLTSELGTATTSSTTTLGSYPRGLCNIRGSTSGLGYQRSSSVVADYGASSGPPSTVSSSSPIVSASAKNVTANSSISRSYTDDTKSLDEQLQGIDSQLLSGRVLCCFSGLYNRGIAARKEGLSQPLLVGLKRRPPLTPKDEYKHIDSSKDLSSKDSPSVLYSRYKSASPTSKQFHSRYSPNPTGSLPPTPPPNDSDLYFMQRFSNKSSLPPTPPSSSSKDSSYFRFNPASLPPTPPPPCSDDRHLKSSSLHESSAKCSHEILLLEKQGRTSQKQRRSSAGSQASSDDLNLSRTCLPLAVPRSKSRPPESLPLVKMNRKGGYNRLEESTSKESLHSSLPNSNVSDKLRLFQQQQAGKSKSSSLSSSSREKLDAGMKYRIQL